MKFDNILITEKLEDINKDINRLYSRVFNDLENIVVHGSTNDLVDFMKKSRHKTSSQHLVKNRIFVSERVITSSLKKPVAIHINVQDSNYYDPVNSTISITAFTDTLRKLFKSYDYSYKSMPRNIQEFIRDNINERHLKSIIAHELTHWIDDSLHGNHIRKHFDKLNKKYPSNSKKDVAKFQKHAKHGYASEYITTEEIQAIVNELKIHKQKYSKWWDDMSFDNLINSIELLKYIHEELKDQPKSLELWKKRLKRRMHREGLLGKNMR